MGFNVFYVCLVGSALYLVSYLFRKRGIPLPPGPPGWPILGNLLDLRAYAPYKEFGAMSKKYGGPIISLSIFGTRCVILNSSKAVKDLLEKKSAITSNRPHSMVACDLIGWGNATPFLQDGDTHRKHRKFFTQHIHTDSSLVVFYPAAEAEAKRFILKVLKKPDDLIADCRATIAALVWKISHGYTVRDEEDPFMDMADKAMGILFEVMSPGRFLADYIPVLRYIPEWLPGGGFRKDARRLRKIVYEVLNLPHKFVLENLANGDTSPSFTSGLLQDGVAPEDEETLKWASFGMYIGTSDTIPSTLIGFFLAMTMYPKVLKKAQGEVDAVIGNRLPTIKDRDTLPYVAAVCKELLRWNVVIPLPSRICTQDIIYEGYLIPKGSHLLANIWYILSDPVTYPDPDVFDPERFLGENQQTDPRETCFGWGKRICLGKRLAESIIFIYVTTALATLDVLPCVENGVECMPKYEFEEGVIRHLKPFKCKILPRSKDVEDILQA